MLELQETQQYASEPSATLAMYFDFILMLRVGGGIAEDTV